MIFVRRFRRILLPIIAVAVAFPSLDSAGIGQDTDAVSTDRQRPLVIKGQLEDRAITPVTARYIGRVIEEAEDRQASAAVLQLDTPGGLMASTQSIVRDIVNSSVPVIVYVSPSGARAASAGVFITLSAHVAAMAPATHIGAAHPVSIGGGAPGSQNGSQQDTTGQAPSSDNPMSEKVINDAVAWVQSLAELRGRNAEWARKAVEESSSITSTEALEKNVVDLLAPTVDSLLAAAHGREVSVSGRGMMVDSRNARVELVDMWWGERALDALANPNLAFLLLMFGFYGILLELYSPGWGVGGTIGAICLLLASFSMSILPVNYAGLALILLGLGLFVAEAFFTSFGALAAGGVVCVGLGGLMLIDAPSQAVQVSGWVVIPVAVATGLIAFFLMGSAVRAMRNRVVTGSEDMIGSTAQAARTFEMNGGQYRGTVRTHGELWQAISSQPIQEGDRLRIADREGLTLTVEPADGQAQTVLDQ